MRVVGTRRIQIADLNTNLFVRKELDVEHALYLAELIENGTPMRDLIEVTDTAGHTNIIVDGRHRKDAYELAKIKEIEVKVLAFESEIEMIGYAYRANSGGSLPPPRHDTEHTVMLFIDRKESLKNIAQLLGLPIGMTRSYVAAIKAKETRQKIAKAISAVTDGGLTVAKAAENYGVDADSIKDHISGKRKGHKNGIDDIQRGLTTDYKSLGSKNAALLRSILDKFEDGDVTRKQVLAILDHLVDLQKGAARSLKSWRDRFEAKPGNKDKAAK